ncbi:hypothetical protein BJ138DRAFT_1144944 [Hygrophoropsis aurantiaca]|uniref:Uncharacterized protein n=1 Tax=Hygrophoropsis aurantiaca TaxID=72124 RepID=A0ACB8AL06_9AGAM|nr:hypothetical protein BJ138DRAFT_1144944 [Hygrophoropsis aurantiaca]
MSTTPGKPRHSGIPTPGKASGIPTPGRFRSVSSVHTNAGLDSDVEYMSRAFADAIKANDPAQHRASLTNGSASPSSSSPKNISASLQSGRRSVAGRPSSVTSSSAPGHTRTKTPAPAPRPSSRQSDVFGRSVSRAGKPFDVGDNVRIESLGYEGTLRYLGDIEGKPGLWAGVELSGGFSGKGKNNGAVNGKQYFTCPANCGVFVATTKLSAPTVGLHFRPPSVASSRSGRVTPSYSGRITPSNSLSNNGRITPSSSFGRTTPHSNPFSASGRITPSVTPASRIRPKVPPNLGASLGSSNGLETITSGSRASKYIGLTAKQLGSRSPGNNGVPPSEVSLDPSNFPSRSSITLDSTVQSTDSPFTTPKAISGSRVGSYTPGLRGRPSMNTPRARVPSAVAMPPPASPAHSASSFSNNAASQGPISSGPSPTELAFVGQDLQDKINLLLSGKTVTSDGRDDEPRSASELSSKLVSAVEGIPPSPSVEAEALQTRLRSLEQENTGLRDAAAKSAGVSENLQLMQTERDVALTNITNLEKDLRTMERSVNERDSKIESLERSAQQNLVDMDRCKAENEARLNDIQARLETSDALIKSLKEAISVKEGAEHETDALLKAKNDEIVLLQKRLEKVSAELEQDRKELGAQIDELRQAGQETIALYEERLSASDTRRYELEDRIIFLEEQAKKASVPLSPGAVSQRASSAAEIDNEMLRDQVQHLHRKISTLEDTLEDVRVMSEREEAALRERIKRFKDKEDAMKTELNEGRKTTEQILKSEGIAKGRVEEAEEALRESTLALENAQAEIEILRADMTTAGLAATAANDSPQKSTEISRQAERERLKLAEEIRELQDQLQQAHINTQEIESRFEKWKATQTGSTEDPEVKDWRTKYEQEHATLASLRETLEERSIELETTKKRLNRELPINGPQESHKMPSSPTKQESAELLGLKLIAQEMQKENLSLEQKTKMLESENRLLLSETDQLRQELKILEENVEQSLLHEEQSLMSNVTSSEPVSSDIQAALKEQKVKTEAELEQLRKRLSDAEMKTARVSHDLNKEISELEALVESKIYREDELEQEVERLKEKLSRHKKSSKGSLDPTDIPRKRSSASTGSTVSLDSYPQRSSDDVCEICERPGHDIFTCDLLKGETPARRGSKPAPDPSALFCVDCESHGHVASDCPHSMDVF